MAGYGLRASLLPSRTFYGHQLEGSALLGDVGVGVLAHDVGLGKTVTAAVLIDDLKTSGELRGPIMSRQPWMASVLWITPASLIPQTVWALRAVLPLAVVESFSFRPGEDRPPADVTVTSLEGLKFRPWIFGVVHGLVVVDECSRLKAVNPTYDSVLAMTANATRVVGLTATPFENDAMETYRMASALCLDIPDERTYVRDHVLWSKAPTFDALGHACDGRSAGFHLGRLPALRRQIHSQFHFATAESAGLRLPVVREHLHPVDLTPAQARAYAMASDARTPLQQHYLQQRATEYEGTDSAGVDFAYQLARNACDRKIVVWCERKYVLELLRRRLAGGGIGAVVITGDNNQAERRQAVDTFRADPNVEVLLGSGALEYGVDGLQHSNYLISLGTTYNPAREAQRLGRLRRVGSPHRHIDHHQIVSRTAHDAHKGRRLVDKRLAGTQMFGEPSYGGAMRPLRLTA